MLKCIKYFRQGLIECSAGDTVELNAVQEAWLLDSWPAHFVPAYAPDAEFVQVAESKDEAQPEAQPVEVVAADIAEPPADKAIKRPRGRK